MVLYTYMLVHVIGAGTKLTEYTESICFCMYASCLNLCMHDVKKKRSDIDIKSTRYLGGWVRFIYNIVTISPEDTTLCSLVLRAWPADFQGTFREHTS